jgi:hypothetical protein
MSWNIAATSEKASDHAEDQVIEFLCDDEQNDVLQNVEQITLQNHDFSPCDDCCGELSKLLRKIKEAQTGNPRLKTAEIYWEKLYSQGGERPEHSANRTTWDGINKLSGWVIRAPPKALPFEMGEMPKYIYKRYVAPKRRDIRGTITPVELSEVEKRKPR